MGDIVEVTPIPIELKGTLAIVIVLGASVFGMLWGLVNALLVSYLLCFHF